MASSVSSRVSSSSFAQTVFASMRNLYPEHLADKSFDNTGVLIEAPENIHRSSKLKNSVLLTIDLTTAVCDEAIERRDSVIVAYHPIIFRGLKSLTLANPQQRTLLRLVQEGISVYCPHTAVDAAQGGNADWLADIVLGRLKFSPHGAETADVGTGVLKEYGLHHFPRGGTMRSDTQLNEKDTCVPIVADTSNKAAGMGRIVTFHEPKKLTELFSRLIDALGGPKTFSVAIPQTSSINDIEVSSVGVCAGSGSSILNKVHADVLLTGELSHHEALAAIEQGQVVIALNHSNSERGYLRGVMQPKLSQALEEEWQRVSKDLANSDKERGQNGSIEVAVSENDRDPFGHLVKV